MVAGHDTARRQHDAVIKTLTLYILQDFLQLTIPLTFIEFVLIVVKKVGDIVLLTDCLHSLALRGEVTDLFINERDPFFGKRTLQAIQM